MNSLFVVLKKEVIDIFRDKKTLTFMLMLSILVYPIMFKIMGYTMDNSRKSVDNEINMVIEGQTDSNLMRFLESQKSIKVVDNISNPEVSLKKGNIQLILYIPEGIDQDIEENKTINIEMLLDNESSKSTVAASTVKEIITQYSNSIVEQRLSDNGIDSNIITPITVEQKSDINRDYNEMDSITTILMGMLPAVLVIMILTPTIGIASDLGAGEKERGTLEPLLTTSANRKSILGGKIVSVSCISVISFILSMGSLIISFKDFIHTIGGDSIDLNINSKTIFFISIVAVLMIITIASIQIGVSIFARSIKEANTYLSGIIMPMMLITFIPVYMDIKSVSSILFNVPVLNIVLIMKEFLFGIYNITHIIIVLFWHIIYISIALTAAKYMFSREDVIFRS